MNNLNLWAGLNPTWKPSQVYRCSGNCSTQIAGLAFWINGQSFWTYRCLCCGAYKFEPGKTSAEWGGLYV